MSRLSLSLLGTPGIQKDGAAIKLETRKAIALLVYLVVKGGIQHRDALIDLLWPDSDPDHARGDLRRTLSDLRTSLAGDWLLTDRDTIALNPGANIWSDVAQFRAVMAQRAGHGHPLSAVCAACLPLLTQAVALHHGDFLSGFSLRDSPDFDDWQFLEAESLRRELSSALEILVQGHTAQGQFDQALTYARQWLALDRLNETACAHLLRLYAWSGQRLAALRQYQECTKILHDQLGVSPQESLTGLYEAIRDGRPPHPPFAQGRAPTAERTPPGAETLPLPEATAVVVLEEKRVVTVLYVDAGATFHGARRFGSEDEAALVRRIVAAAGDILHQHDGQIVRSVGDGILAVCGLAQTHESDPELAIRSALAIREEAEKLGLTVTTGISTGEIYSNRTDAHDATPSFLVGGAVAMATRLAGQALVGQILVAESTYRLTRHAFDFTRRDPATSAPFGAVYQVEHLLAHPAKVRGIEGLRANLTGRDDEFAKLKVALARVHSGEGQMVSIIGEAGVGKSRLVAELKEYAAKNNDSLLWLEGRCLELGMAVSYAPFLDILRTYFGWTDQDNERTRQESVVSFLQRLADQGHLGSERQDEATALLCHLLSLPAGDKWDQQLKDLSPEYVRFRTFLTVRDFVAALARQQPLVLVFEDLHWADSLSLELITLLMEGLCERSVLLLCAYRPERESAVRRLATIADQKCRACYRELRLHELTQQESRQLVASLLTIEGLPTEVRDMVLARAQGNPFFIEEILRSLIDAGTVYREGEFWHARPEIGSLVVPDSVQSVILSRVDRLGPETKTVLQAAAVIGPLFRQQVLGEVTGNAERLARALDDLADRALVYPERMVPEVELSFKHVLTQQAVYANIVSAQRVWLHQQIAGAIETLYHDDLTAHYEQLAYHYEQGGLLDKAVGYLLKSGQKATNSFADEAAIAHLTRGLELLKSQPDSRQRAARELELLYALWLPLTAGKSPGAHVMQDMGSRILELSQQLGDSAARVWALARLWGFQNSWGHQAQAMQLATQAMDLAEATGDPRLLAAAHRLMGNSCSTMGDLIQAQSHYDEGLALCYAHADRADADENLLPRAQTTGFLFLSSINLWQLGYADQALGRSREALTLAEESSNPGSVANVLVYCSMLHMHRREPQLTEKDADALIKSSTESHWPYGVACGTALHGWAMAQLGQADTGIAQIRQGADAVAAFGIAATKVLLNTLLAEAYLQARQSGEALSITNESLENIATTGGGLLFEGETYRLQGEAWLLQGSDAKAEACFQRALEITRSRQAKAWELRAATSMARLWQKQGKPEQARALLQAIYGLFTEGFDTADLQDTRELLDALAVR